MAVLVPDERCLILFWKYYVCQKSKQIAFHLGSVDPPSGEGSPIDFSWVAWVDNMLKIITVWGKKAPNTSLFHSLGFFCQWVVNILCLLWGFEKWIYCRSKRCQFQVSSLNTLQHFKLEFHNHFSNSSFSPNQVVIKTFTAWACLQPVSPNAIIAT